MAKGLPEGVIAGIEQRDPDAVAACYEQLADPLFRYLLALGAPWALAEDLVEDTFVELLEQAPSLHGGVSGLRAWLFRAARNNLLDARRKEIRRGDRVLDEQAAARKPASGPGPEDLAVLGGQAETMQGLLEQLSADQREVLVLRFVADLTGPEVAAATGRTVGAVKALQHRGLAALERLLEHRP